MWIMTNNSYLSIVSKDCGPADLLVRARRAGDIEKVFPNAKVTRQTDSDYLYRAVVVKQALAAMIDLIDTRTSRIALKTSHCMLPMLVSGVQWQDYSIRRQR